jgi:hypothetical protein
MLPKIFSVFMTAPFIFCSSLTSRKTMVSSADVMPILPLHLKVLREFVGILRVRIERGIQRATFTEVVQRMNLGQEKSVHYLIDSLMVLLYKSRHKPVRVFRASHFADTTSVLNFNRLPKR